MREVCSSLARPLARSLVDRLACHWKFKASSQATMSFAEYCKYNQLVYIEMRDFDCFYRHSLRNSDDLTICKLETVLKFDDFNVLVFCSNKQCIFD